MAEQTPQSFNHFGLVAFRDAFWQEAPATRRQLMADWLGRLRQRLGAVHAYQTQAAEAASDLLLWSASAGDDVALPAEFLGAWAAAFRECRRYVTLRETLWGFTKPSQYTKARSTQEMDPFAGARAPYLVMYPFTKTADWYQLPREQRRELMGEHIKVGKQYPDITQLLLYSTGVQDQEFVVVYETANLLRFSDLVTELRSTAARPYTERDAPLHTAVYQPDLNALARWL